MRRISAKFLNNKRRYLCCALNGLDSGVVFAPGGLTVTNFHAVHRDWRGKKITLRQAAEACGMPEGTFYYKAVQFEKAT